MPKISSAQDLFNEGNAAFVEDDFTTAIQKYTDAIEIEPSGEYYLKRSIAAQKLEKYSDALKDAEQACSLMKDNYKCFLRKGMAHFYREEVNEAKKSFEESLQLSGNNEEIKTWISKCDAKLKAHSSRPETKTTQEQKQKSSTSSSGDSVGKAGGTSLPSSAKARYDWYQTETHIIITILLKNTKKEDVAVHYSLNAISATVKLPNGNDFSLELDLAHPIVPDQCVTRIMSTKIELKIKKAEGIRWSSLETDNESQFSNLKGASGENKDDTVVKKYPSSAQKSHDWDKLAAEIQKEEENEKDEGDAALNKLFQKIYSDGNDEVRKAMNKSFVESGGTVLSTNWKEVKNGHVECKPPDGMEYKKYEY